MQDHDGNPYWHVFPGLIQTRERGLMGKVAIPVQTDGRLNSTNGFTIGKRYPILWENDRVAEVLNDNGHRRVIGLDEGTNAHLQYRPPGKTMGDICAGYFKIEEDECDSTK